MRKGAARAFRRLGLRRRARPPRVHVQRGDAGGEALEAEGVGVRPARSRRARLAPLPVAVRLAVARCPRRRTPRHGDCVVRRAQLALREHRFRALHRSGLVFALQRQATAETRVSGKEGRDCLSEAASTHQHASAALLVRHRLRLLHLRHRASCVVSSRSNKQENKISNMLKSTEKVPHRVQYFLRNAAGSLIDCVLCCCYAHLGAPVPAGGRWRAAAAAALRVRDAP